LGINKKHNNSVFVSKNAKLAALPVETRSRRGWRSSAESPRRDWSQREITFFARLRENGDPEARY